MSDLTIVSLDGRRIDAKDSSGVMQASLIYTIDYVDAKLIGDEIFEMKQLNDDTWVTIFKDQNIEKLIVSIKLVAKNVFSIKSFYGRTKYFVKQSEKLGHFILTNEKKQTLIEIVRSSRPNENQEIFDIKTISNFTLQSEWFLILHAVHCVLYFVRLSDESFIESFSH